jgi:hypothetical protein
MWRIQSGTHVLTKVERACLAIGVEELLERITLDMPQRATTRNRASQSSTGSLPNRSC